MTDIVDRIRSVETTPLDGTEARVKLWEVLQDARAEIARLRLTDAEREAVAWAEDCADSQREWKIGATLRGLLERLR